MSTVIVSDVRDHDKHSVVAFTSKVVNRVKVRFPTVNKIAIWTDGSSSQLKKVHFPVLRKAQLDVSQP